MTKAKWLAVAFLEFLLGALLSGQEPLRLHEEPEPQKLSQSSDGMP
jgi:hypothetical protein